MMSNDKIVVNKVAIRARIYDAHKPYLEGKSCGFDFYYGELPPKTKDSTIRQLDACWEKLKYQLLDELYGE